MVCRRAPPQAGWLASSSGFLKQLYSTLATAAPRPNDLASRVRKKRTVSSRPGAGLAVDRTLVFTSPQSNDNRLTSRRSMGTMR